MTESSPVSMLLLVMDRLHQLNRTAPSASNQLAIYRCQQAVNALRGTTPERTHAD